MGSVTAEASSASANDDEGTDAFCFASALNDLPPDLLHSIMRQTVRTQSAPRVLDSLGLALSCRLLRQAMKQHWVAHQHVSVCVQRWAQLHSCMQRAVDSAISTAAMAALDELHVRHNPGVSYAATRDSPPQIHFYDEKLEKLIVPPGPLSWLTFAHDPGRALRQATIRIAKRISTTTTLGVSQKALDLWVDDCLPARAQRYAYDQEDGEWRWPSTVEDIDPTRRPLALAFACQKLVFALEWNPRCKTDEEVAEEQRIQREEDECSSSDLDEYWEESDPECSSYEARYALEYA